MAETKLKKKQYTLINAMRLIAAFFVVAIHIHFPGGFGNVVIAVARFAVPFFFMVSGFFSHYENRDVVSGKMKHKILHTTSITAGSILLYIVYKCAMNFFAGTLSEYLNGQFNLSSAFEFIVFNQVRVSEHLWFLPALLYVYIIFFLFQKIGFAKRSFFLIPLLLAVSILLRELPEFIPDMPDIFNKSYLCRNFLFDGLPFFLLGYHIKLNEEKLTAKLTNLSLVIMMIIGTAAAVAVDTWHTQKSFYAGTVLAVFALFVFVIKNEGKVNMTYLASAGSKYSLYIYVTHIIVKDVIKKAFEILNLPDTLDTFVSWILPFAVFILSFGLSVVYVWVKGLIKNIKVVKQ